MVKHDLVSHSSEEVLYSGNDRHSSINSIEDITQTADKPTKSARANGLNSSNMNHDVPKSKHGLDVRPHTEKSSKCSRSNQLKSSKEPRERKGSFWSFQVASVLTPATILQPTLHMVCFLAF